MPKFADRERVISKWERAAYAGLNERFSVLPEDHGSMVRDEMLETASREDTSLIPLIKARFSASPNLYQGIGDKDVVGEPFKAEQVQVTGHISRSTLWLIDEQGNQMQTMVRVAVLKPNGLAWVDVYSDAVSPWLWGRTPEVEKTISSRDDRLLQYVEATDAEVLGWVPITEIDEQVIPSTGDRKKVI